MQKSKILLLIISAIVFSELPALAQPGYYYGQNKVAYKNFDWAVFRTDHFDVHYYTEEAEAAFDAARMAERGYEYLSTVLDHQIKSRIPLILYSSLNDFQQTNVVSGMIGEGTRGVTESMRKRVVLPITGSYREFNHVLVHELVHAFQFDMMKTYRGDGLGGFNPPLWFVEGMAEYLSNGMDNITRTWVRDGLLHDKLLTIDKLNSTFDIRVYRLGQAVWYHIGETYGKDKVGLIFKTAIRMGDVERALTAQIGKNFKQVTKEWHTAARTLVLPADSTLQSPEAIAQLLTKPQSFFHRMNVVPAISPDGRHIAYISNQALNDGVYLLTRREDGSYDDREVAKGGLSRSLEAVRFFDTNIGWSFDGQRLTFVAKAGKDDAIYVVNPHTGEVHERLVFDQLNGLLSANFSPDGSQLVFVGIGGGRSDLYLYDLNARTLDRLTEDVYTERYPQWSPDGRFIAFSTDRGAGTSVDSLLFGDLDLALYSLESREIEMITELPGEVIGPQWSNDSKEIAFVSDHQGIANIYLMNLENREVRALTHLKNGVTGITEATPAMSWSLDGKSMVFSSFWKEGWQLYRMTLPESAPAITFNATPATPASSDDVIAATETIKLLAGAPVDSAWLPDNPEPNDFYGGYALADEDSVEARDYSSKPKFMAASVGASFGGYFGTVGGAQFLFSDMLNNHNLMLSANVRSRILNTDLGLVYYNQAKRLNWGVELYQLNSFYGAFLTPTSNGFVEQKYRGFSLFTFFPFSRFSRLELSGGLTFVENNLVVEEFDFNNGTINRDTRNLPGSRFGQVAAAWVYDNTLFGLIGPLRGRRTRLEVQRTLDDFKFTTAVLDHRQYFNVGYRSNFAWRLLGGASFARDAQVFRLGGPYTFRGSDYGGLIGTRFFVNNFEYRYPLLPFLPPQADLLSGIAFIDMAAAWGLEVPGLVKSTFQPFSSDGGFRLNDLRAAFGVGARLNLGYLAFRFDVAWPTDLQNTGGPTTFFSIGTDF